MVLEPLLAPPDEPRCILRTEPAHLHALAADFSPPLPVGHHPVELLEDDPERGEDTEDDGEDGDNDDTDARVVNCIVSGGECLRKQQPEVDRLRLTCIKYLQEA